MFKIYFIHHVQIMNQLAIKELTHIFVYVELNSEEISSINVYHFILTPPPFQFLKAMATVTGKDSSPFIEQWVLQCGVPKFYGSFVFNRKRNVVELELKQDFTSKGSMKYVVSVAVNINKVLDD